MSGDYSRQRFDPSKHFSAVLMQQGRVQLDADWNEQGAILDRRWRAETIDLIGRSGVPRETPDGFRIVAAGDTFTIGPGRIYVDGLLAENYGRGVLTFDPVLMESRSTTAVPYAAATVFPHAAAAAVARAVSGIPRRLAARSDSSGRCDVAGAGGGDG